MTDDGNERVPPDGRAWKDQQQGVQDRNEAARKVGREQRKAREKQVELMRRAEEKRGDVYR
jgi:hypothetical protein